MFFILVKFIPQFFFALSLQPVARIARVVDIIFFIIFTFIFAVVGGVLLNP